MAWPLNKVKGLGVAVGEAEGSKLFSGLLPMELLLLSLLVLSLLGLLGLGLSLSLLLLRLLLRQIALMPPLHSLLRE